MRNAFATLLRTGPATAAPRLLGRPTVWRLLGCYAAALAFVLVVNAVAPLAESADGRLLAPWAERLVFGTAGGERVVPTWVDAALAMAGAFLLSVPIVIVYVRTRTHATFDDSLANTVLVLPAVVTVILIVVQSSLALAFSLAGIVAAVRFRTNLKESRDALYILAGVAIGFASGVYALDVAMVASVIFTLIEVLTWRTDLGAQHAPPILEPAPRAPAPPPAAGNGHAPEPAEPAVRDVVLRVQVTDVDEGRRVTEPVLDAHAKQWRRQRIHGEGRPLAVIEYRLRLRKRATTAALRDEVYRAGLPFVMAVDVAPLHQEDGAPHAP